MLNLANAVVRGRLPEKQGEILISDDFARRLDIQPGQTATLIGSTMYGNMATANFTAVGMIHFGISALDRGTMLADLADIQTALDMEDAAGEILIFFDDFKYRKFVFGLGPNPSPFSVIPTHRHPEMRVSHTKRPGQGLKKRKKSPVIIKL
jgi:ABC-type lipoprotein release transport system permease subunit